MGIDHLRQSGVTIVEVLFALIVVAISGVWLLGAYHSGIHLTEVSQEAAIALNNLRDMAERIKSSPFNASLPADFPDGISGDGAIGSGGDVGTGADQYPNIVGIDVNGDSVRDYRLTNEQITVAYRDQNGAVFSGTAAQTLSAINAEIQNRNPLQIIVTVNWVNRARTYTKTLSTLKAS
jgi:hypothetical protein